LISSAIDKADSSSGAALYDAVGTSAAYLDKVAHFKKRILIVVFDHGDNMSHISSQQLFQQLRGPQKDVAIHYLALFDPGNEPGTARIFQTLAKETGTVVFVSNLKKLNHVAQQLAEDIHNAQTRD